MIPCWSRRHARHPLGRRFVKGPGTTTFGLIKLTLSASSVVITNSMRIQLVRFAACWSVLIWLDPASSSSNRGGAWSLWSGGASHVIGLCSRSCQLYQLLVEVGNTKTTGPHRPLLALFIRNISLSLSLARSVVCAATSSGVACWIRQLWSCGWLSLTATRDAADPAVASPFTVRHQLGSTQTEMYTASLEC